MATCCAIFRFLLCSETEILILNAKNDKNTPKNQETLLRTPKNVTFFCNFFCNLWVLAELSVWNELF